MAVDMLLAVGTAHGIVYIFGKSHCMYNSITRYIFCGKVHYASNMVVGTLLN